MKDHRNINETGVVWHRRNTWLFVHVTGPPNHLQHEQSAPSRHCCLRQSRRLWNPVTGCPHGPDPSGSTTRLLLWPHSMYEINLYTYIYIYIDPCENHSKLMGSVVFSPKTALFFASRTSRTWSRSSDLVFVPPGTDDPGAARAGAAAQVLPRPGGEPGSARSLRVLRSWPHSSKMTERHRQVMATCRQWWYFGRLVSLL